MYAFSVCSQASSPESTRGQNDAIGSYALLCPVIANTDHKIIARALLGLRHPILWKGSNPFGQKPAREGVIEAESGEGDGVGERLEQPFPAEAKLTLL